MKVEIHDKPWKHAIIDDLLPQNIFDKLLNFALEYNKSPQVANDAIRFSNHQQACYWGDDIGKLYTVLVKTIDYIWDNYYKVLNFTDRDETELLSERSVEILYTQPQSNKEKLHGSVHTDTKIKLLSTCLYLFPEKGQGTILHNQDKTVSHMVEWKQNRALSFVRNGAEEMEENSYKKTFHSYINTNEVPRISVNLFWMKDKK